MDLSIIIVNWRSTEYLRACILSVQRETFVPKYEIVVVDNASNDRCGELLANEFPQVVFIQSDKNLGFARANNLGACRARGKTLLLLNPDTEILNRALEILYKQLEVLPDAGVLGAHLLNTDRTFQSSCVQAFPTIANQLFAADILYETLARWRSPFGQVLPSAHESLREVPMVSGACMMIRKDLFERIGGFSTDYFMYSEDLDLCFKTQKAGFRNYYVGGAEVVHHGGGSSQKARSNFAVVMMRDSVCRFLCKFRGNAYGLAYRLSTAAAAVGRLSLLFVLLPLWILRGRLSRWRVSWSKWQAILRWTFGLAGWANQAPRAPSEEQVQVPKMKSCVESVES